MYPTQFLSSSPEAVFSIFLDIFVYIRSADLSYVAGTFLVFFVSDSLTVPFWVKVPEFEPKECRERERPTELSFVVSRNLVMQPRSQPGSPAI